MDMSIPATMPHYGCRCAKYRRGLLVDAEDHQAEQVVERQRAALEVVHVAGELFRQEEARRASTQS